MASVQRKTRVGIVGYGHLGQFLVDRILSEGDAHGLELAFVWNRTQSAMEGDKVAKELRLHDLGAFADFAPDLVVEVAHPSITTQYGKRFLERCDYFVGSPTAFADPANAGLLTSPPTHALFVPAGAFWGAQDVHKMSRLGTLHSLRVSMAFHPKSLRLAGVLKDKLAGLVDAHGDGDGFGKHLLFRGSVRDLCPLAPNNVNTMAVASLAAQSIGGFDGVQAELFADTTHGDAHSMEFAVQGKGEPKGLSVVTQRVNPARPGGVTGSATFMSFWASLLDARGRGPGLHLC